MRKLHRLSRRVADGQRGPAVSERERRLLVERASLLIELRALRDELEGQESASGDVHRQLEDSLARYSALYDFGPIGHAVIDRNGVIYEMNVTGAELLGFERDQLMQRPFLQFVDAPDRRTFLQHLSSCRRGARKTVSQVHVVNKNRNLVPVQLTTQPAPDASGTFWTAIVDLTERKMAEAEVQRLAAAEAAARAETQAKDRFLAMLSHELRTPLTPVLAGLATLALREDVAPTARDLLAVVRRNVELEARLVDDLLDATRIVHGKLQLTRAPVDVHGVVRDVVEEFSEALEEKRIELSLHLVAARHHVSGDDVRLRQVFLNLLGNAVKFTPERRRVAVRSWNQGNEMLIEVSDTGLGLERGDIQKLFQPFEQVEAGSRREGLGLGLAICKGIVELHGGSVHVASEGVGRGSRFVVQLETVDAPVEPVELQQPEEPRELEQPPAVGPARGRLLLVDDHHDTAMILAWILERAGYQVTVAPTLEAALKLAAREFDLLVSDIGLPDGSGLDLMRRFRKKGVRGIALSGYGTERDVALSRDAGFEMHLTKPVEMGTLLEAIGSLIPPPQRRRPAEPASGHLRSRGAHVPTLRLGGRPQR